MNVDGARRRMRVIGRRATEEYTKVFRNGAQRSERLILPVHVWATVLPWMVGIFLVLPTALPLPTWISLVYVLAAGLGTIWFTEFSKQEKTDVASGTPLPNHFLITPWLIYLLLFTFSIVVLRNGLALN